MDSIPRAGRGLWPCPGKAESNHSLLPSQAKGGIIAASALFLALTSCQYSPDEQTAEYFVFGTRVGISVRAAEESTAARAFRQLGTDFQQMHERWHPWEPGALSALNRDLADGVPVPIPQDLAELIRASQRMETLSRGHFNAAIGELVSLWGFHTSDYPITEPPPTDQDIAKIVAQQPSAHDIAFDGEQVRSDNAAARLDFSGIAKGVAVARACARLAEFGITDALVNAGGDVMVCGPAATPWRIGVRNPAGGEPLDTLEISEPMAVFTSGNYQRFGQWQGERYAHILDPRSGYPVREIMQATVLHPDPVLADAAATALVVAGTDGWREVAKAMGLERVMIVREDGRVEISGR